MSSVRRSRPTRRSWRADRCLECGGPYAEAPCTAACPADVDVPRFVAAVAAGDPAGAAATIFENVLGGTCARVCPVEVLCQRDCVLVNEETAARSRSRPCSVTRRTGPTSAAGRSVRLLREQEAGGRDRRRPAGLAAAGELAARGYGVTVYDERAEIGGLVRDRAVPADQRAAARRGSRAR